MRRAYPRGLMSTDCRSIEQIYLDFDLHLRALEKPIFRRKSQFLNNLERPIDRYSQLFRVYDELKSELIAESILSPAQIRDIEVYVQESIQQNTPVNYFPELQERFLALSQKEVRKLVSHHHDRAYQIAAIVLSIIALTVIFVTLATLFAPLPFLIGLPSLFIMAHTSLSSLSLGAIGALALMFSTLGFGGAGILMNKSKPCCTELPVEETRSDSLELIEAEVTNNPVSRNKQRFFKAAMSCLKLRQQPEPTLSTQNELLLT